MSGKVLVLPALGRPFTLGMLYDARNDKLSLGKMKISCFLFKGLLFLFLYSFYCLYFPYCHFICLTNFIFFCKALCSIVIKSAS